LEQALNIDTAWRILGKAMREVLDSALRKWAGLRIADAFLGARYSYVELVGGWCGVAYVPGHDLGREVDVLEEATPRLLARLVERGFGRGAASLALAAINAATMAWIYESLDPPVIVEKRLSDIVGAGRGDKVVVLGYMRGIVDEFLEAGAEVYVSEIGEDLYPEAARDAESKGFTVISRDEAEHYLKKATIMVASGSALLYPELTLRELKAASNARERVFVGPTSSFHPLLGRKIGVTLVGGVYIDPSMCNMVRWHVAGGGGLHSFRRKGAKAPLLPKIYIRV
jgi:uncharacterized protein (DUF4213/DUF364 family)